MVDACPVGLAEGYTRFDSTRFGRVDREEKRRDELGLVLDVGVELYHSLASFPLSTLIRAALFLLNESHQPVRLLACLSACLPARLVTALALTHHHHHQHASKESNDWLCCAVPLFVRNEWNGASLVQPRRRK